MPLVNSQQIDRLLDSYIKILGISITASTSSTDISSALQTALNTAGQGGVALPLQVASDTQVGIVTSPYNRCELSNSTTLRKISTSDKEVYGRLTKNASNAWILSYKYLNDSGSETDYIFPTASLVDVDFAYRFDFGTLPNTAIIGLQARQVYQDISSTNRFLAFDLLTYSAGALSQLKYTPVSGTLSALTNNDLIRLSVNGVNYYNFGANPPFSISGKQITWNAANAGFSLNSSQQIIAEYWTLG